MLIIQSLTFSTFREYRLVEKNEGYKLRWSTDPVPNCQETNLEGLFIFINKSENGCKDIYNVLARQNIPYENPGIY